MKYQLNLLLLFIVSLIFSACQNNTESTDQVNSEASNTTSIDSLKIQNIEYFDVESSIRAIQVVAKDQVWFAGSAGKWGYTANGGQSWTIDSIITDTIIPHFRSMAITGDAAHLLSIASPALLYRSMDKGKNWDIVYREDHPGAFYDAMLFLDETTGIAMGDPTDNCLSVIRTEDGGLNWNKVDCTNLPEATEGEAAFAASNSNLAALDNKVWMVSGGAKANVYQSEDKGKTWTVAPTPIAQGGQMTGIYTVAFQDENNGIVFGGDWNAKEVNSQNKAITKDGGKTWELLADGEGPGYRSQVRYIPNTNGQGIIACGIPGISYSLDGGKNWTDISEEPFYAMDFEPDGKVLWLSGANRITKLIFE
ncbi:MAG: oxidoreductase [Bacteroidota bacterium]